MKNFESRLAAGSMNMHKLVNATRARRCPRGILLAAVLLACGGVSGCAALTNPVADGVPVHRLPPELLGVSKVGEHTITLSSLRQKPPDVYRLAPGDVLGVWIEGILGERGQAPPVRFPESSSLTPALGYPFPIREDGRVPLPLVEPVRVQDLSLAEAEEAIRQAYTVKKQILKPGQERIIVTLMRPRQYHVLVVRRDSESTLNVVSTGFFGQELIGADKRGTGHALDLPAYENDLLNALAKTGGLPGDDASDEILIERGVGNGDPDLAAAQRLLDAPKDGRNGNVVRIPLRVRQGEDPTIKQEDIILHSGDVVYIGHREPELFYTAGLLPPGEHVLPRDYDLDVIQAIMRTHGPLVSGDFGVINFGGTIVLPGIGNPSSTLLTVLRQAPGGGQIPIRVDLDRALRDPRERILVQAGDVLVLQETSGQALARYFTQQFNITGVFRLLNRRDATITNTISGP